MAGDQPDWTGTQVNFAQQRAYVATKTGTATITSGSNEAITFIAPTGTFVTIGGVRADVGAPTGGSSGFHEIEIYQYIAGSEWGYLAAGTSTGASGISYNYGYWVTANSSQEPPSTGDQSWYVGALGMDDVNGLTFLYSNNTGVDQTLQRDYAVMGIQTLYQP